METASRTPPMIASMARTGFEGSSNLVETLPLERSTGDIPFLDDSTLEQTVPKNDDSKAYLSDVTKVGSALRNFSIECPNFPNHQMTCLLHHLCSFFPGIVLTATTLKQEGKLDVYMKKFPHGRYAHSKN